jgi:hypothetical protein
MRKNIEKVLKAFHSGKASGNGGSCWTDGNTLYSYRTPIVKRDVMGMIWVMDKYPSVTTQGQINSCKSFLLKDHNGHVVSTLDHIRAA